MTTAHELARKLLAGADYDLFVNVNGKDEAHPVDAVLSMNSDGDDGVTKPAIVLQVRTHTGAPFTQVWPYTRSQTGLTPHLTIKRTMNTVQFKLAPTAVMREIYFEADQARYAWDHLHLYEAARVRGGDLFQTLTAKSAEEICEDLFDMTNNPSRQEERELRYGRGRSLSIGDVVLYNDETWLCCTVGWKKIGDGPKFVSSIG